MRTYKYRLCPTKYQVQLLADTLKSCRALYNCALEQRKLAYRQFGVSLNYYSQADELIVFEDLQVKNMVKNHHLAKSISDASWSRFIEYTSYKAESAGRKVIFVNPRNTSQVCSVCSMIVKKSLSVRVHKCPHWGLVLDRDINAAINILRRGTRPGGATAVAG